MTGEEFVDLDAIERYCRDHPDYHCDLPTEQVLNLIRTAKMKPKESNPMNSRLGLPKLLRRAEKLVKRSARLAPLTTELVSAIKDLRVAVLRLKDAAEKENESWRAMEQERD